MTDWGPIAELAAELDRAEAALAMSRAHRARRHWWHRGAWRHRITPETEAPEGPEPVSPWELYVDAPADAGCLPGIDWPAALTEHAVAAPDFPAGTRSRLGPLLVNCHVWLDRQLLEWAGRVVSPFWTDIPLMFADHTPRALNWALACHALDRGGPEAVVAPYRLAGLDLGDNPAPGDLLSAHLFIEAVAGPAADNAAVTPWRHRGGLRAETFLATVPSAYRATRRQALDLLAARSPLTRLVYGDVFGLDEGCAVALRALTAPTSGPTSWRVVWYSQVARSLVGVTASEAPSYERLNEAEAQVARLEGVLARAKQGRVGRTPPLAVQRAESNLRLARAELDACTSAHASERVARIGGLAALLRPTGEPAGGAPFIHARWLDMLVRAAVSRAWGGGMTQWRTRVKFPPPVPGEMLCGESGTFFLSFERLLFGDTFQCLLAAQAADFDAATLVPLLSELLDWPIELGADELASLGGIPLTAAQELLARFAGERRGAIVLPFAGDPIEPPRVLLAGTWLPAFLERLPRHREEVLSTHVEYD